MTGDAMSIVDRVRALYEAHPYPHYPLFARPRLADGFLVPSSFAGALCGRAAAPDSGTERIEVLVGGSGEILPYVARHLEPRRNDVVCLDLSRTSLWRARVRLGPFLPAVKRTAFVRGDLDDYLAARAPGTLHHVDAYGVVYYMADPGRTLSLIGRALAPGGTLRLMVYNSTARAWIHELQRAFALLRLGNDKADIAAARRLVLQAAAGSPALTARLAQVGRGTLASDARFADLFLHPREARISVATWYAHLAAAGLAPRGLLDRYGELDDLENPLWRAPTERELTPRVADRRFEGNLELFAQKGEAPARTRARDAQRAPFVLGTGPRLWWSFDETRRITSRQRARIWAAHRRFVAARERVLSEREIARLTTQAVGRLARLGAFLPGMLEGPAANWAKAPLSGKLDAPDRYESAAALPKTLSATIHEMTGDDQRRAECILARLDRTRRA